MPAPTEHPQAQTTLHRMVNRSALIVFTFLAMIGVLRLLTTLLTADTLPLKPIDGWFLMSLRTLAVILSLGALLVQSLRQRFFFLLLALVTLTSAGLAMRLGSLLPPDWHPTAGVAQLLLSVLGVGMAIAGLAQGEDLVAFLRETWGLTHRSKSSGSSVDNR